MLEAEMDEKFGYSKYDYKNKETDGNRNGYSRKTVTSSFGEIGLDIPRDRKGKFKPQAVKKNQTDIYNIKDQVLSMYAKGMMSAHLSSGYWVDAFAEMISHMTDRILPIAKAWQDRPLESKPFMKELKQVYQARTEEAALEAMDSLEGNWGTKYPSSIASWRDNWPQLSTYFKYPAGIRKLIYTMNSIENFNRQLRKVMKNWTIFPTDDALFKLLYLAVMDIKKKWTGRS